MATILDDKNFDDCLKSQKPFVVKFFSLWDSSSRSIEDIFKEIADEFSGKAKFMQSNMNSNPELAEKCHITKVPTIAVFSSGKVVMRITSFPSKRALKEQMENVFRSLSQ
jgi:thioredoxin-like negative regulator of GroEL